MNTEILFKGLNTSDVEILRAQFGYNDVSKNRSNIVWIFMNIVTNPVIIINLILIIISFYFKYTITLYAFGFLMIFNLINHLISTKNQLMIKSMHNVTINNCVVIRDGLTLSIPSRELVPQDIILLKSGDIVPADVTIIQSDGIETEDYNDNSSTDTKSTQLNVGYAVGILDGYGYAQVDKTGNDITTSAKDSKISAFRNINQLDYVLLFISLIHIIITLMMNTKFVFNSSSLIIFVLFLVFVELLILINSIINKHKISKLLTNASQNSTKLKSIESLKKIKKINLICVDKSGVLTTGINTVSKVIVDNQKLNSYLLKIPRQELYTPIEDLILDYSSQFTSIRSVLNTGEYLEYIPYTSDKKLSGFKFKNGTLWFGTPKKVMTKLIMDELSKLEILSKIDQEEQAGLKSIGIGWADSYNYSRSYLGTYLISDPLKQNTASIIQDLKSSGITTKIISSDSLMTNTQIAIDSKVSLSKEFGINASDLDYTNLEVLKEQVKFYSLFANTNSDQKQFILEAMKLSHNIGYLGDGIEDINSLKIADVAIVKSNGTNVAIKVSDLLIDDANLEQLKNILLQCRGFDIM